jgi:hypothetical protein
MPRTIILGLLAVYFLFVTPGLAGTIYTWTDADGVRRYSNAKPPEGARDVRAIDEVKSNRQKSGQIRPSYNRMVEEANRDADRQFREQADKKAHNAEAAIQQKQAKKDAQIEKERTRLQKKIEEIQRRGLGPTFSAGQKKNMIREIQEQIDQLE